MIRVQATFTDEIQGLLLERTDPDQRAIIGRCNDLAGATERARGQRRD